MAWAPPLFREISHLLSQRVLISVWCDDEHARAPVSSAHLICANSVQRAEVPDLPGANVRSGKRGPPSEGGPASRRINDLKVDRRVARDEAALGRLRCKPNVVDEYAWPLFSGLGGGSQVRSPWRR